MIIYNKIIPFKGFVAINILGIIFAKRKLTAVELKHELIHTAQMKRYWYVGFYLLYMFYCIKYGYDNNPFEIEAYESENN